MISQLQLQLQYKYSTLVHLIEVHIIIMRTLVYGHIHVCVMYAVVSPPAAQCCPCAWWLQCQLSWCRVTAQDGECDV